MTAVETPPAPLSHKRIHPLQPFLPAKRKRAGCGDFHPLSGCSFCLSVRAAPPQFVRYYVNRTIE
jgi:hypothetical protein